MNRACTLDASGVHASCMNRMIYAPLVCASIDARPVLRPESSRPQSIHSRFASVQAPIRVIDGRREKLNERRANPASFWPACCGIAQHGYSNWRLTPPTSSTPEFSRGVRCGEIDRRIVMRGCAPMKLAARGRWLDRSENLRVI